MLHRKDGQEGREKILLEDPCYALRIPPGKRSWSVPFLVVRQLDKNK